MRIIIFENFASWFKALNRCWMLNLRLRKCQNCLLLKTIFFDMQLCQIKLIPFWRLWNSFFSPLYILRLSNMKSKTKFEDQFMKETQMGLSCGKIDRKNQTQMWRCKFVFRKSSSSSSSPLFL